MKKRTQEDFEIVIGTMLKFYESYVSALKLSSEDAAKKVIKDYDDIADWAYREGDFKE